MCINSSWNPFSKEPLQPNLVYVFTVLQCWNTLHALCHFMHDIQYVFAMPKRIHKNRLVSPLVLTYNPWCGAFHAFWKENRLLMYGKTIRNHKAIQQQPPKCHQPNHTTKIPLQMMASCCKITVFPNNEACSHLLGSISLNSLLFNFLFAISNRSLN